MPFEILYIDDEPASRSQIFADGLSSSKLINIVVEQPDIFEILIDEILKKQDTFDALILDLKLDGNQQGDRIASYTAPSLATGIRAKCFSENGFKKEFPIFLISSRENLERYYDPDTASHDLFDFTLKKTNIDEKGEFYESVIASIITSYKTINENKKDYAKILGIENIELIDDRIFTNRFIDGVGVSVSEISQYIFNELIMKSGVLIDDSVLAARLGINYAESEDWSKLLEQLETAKYSGIFSSAYKRWWTYDTLKWWNDKFNTNPLIRLSADERVKLISEKFQFNKLVVAEQIDKTTSSKYWTICQAYKRPLDPKDGFLVDGNQLYPWQDKKYLSLESLLERKAKDLGLTIHHSERERFMDLKREYTQ